MEGSPNGYGTALEMRREQSLAGSTPAPSAMTRLVDLRKKTEKKEILPMAERSPLIEQKATEEILKGTVIANPLPEKTNHFEWEAPSFYYNPQKKYLTLIVIALLAGAGAMFFYRMDTLTAIFLILSSMVLILYTNKKPTLSRIVVSHAGVTIDDIAYYYKDLKSFWLDYSPHGPKELSLEAKKWYMPYIKVSIEDQNPVEIRSLMINFVTEREHEKSLVDLISRRIGL